MIFFNSHKKTGKKIGQSIKEVLHQPFNSLGKSVPDNFYTDHYIYGFINASTTNLMAFVFGGKDWSQQKKRGMYYGGTFNYRSIKHFIRLSH